MRVTTETGSSYYISFESMQVLRTRNYFGGGELRKDGVALPLLDIELPITVGESLRMLLDVRGDGIATYRETSRVTGVLL